MSRKIRFRIDKQSFEATWSHDEVKGFLQECLELVEELDPPDDLRAHVFQIGQGMLATYHPTDTAVAVPQIVPGKFA